MRSGVDPTFPMLSQLIFALQWAFNPVEPLGPVARAFASRSWGVKLKALARRRRAQVALSRMRPPALAFWEKSL